MKTKKTNQTEAVKKKMTKVVRKIDFKKIGLAVAALVLAGGFYWYGMVAMVNGRPVWRWTYIKNMEKQSGKQVLDQMVNEALILVEAQKNKVKIEQSTIDEEISKIKDRLEGQGQNFDEVLKTEGMTMADLEQQIRMQKLVETLAETNEEVSSEKIDEFLETYKDQLPEGMSEEELTALAKEQLLGQAKNEAVNVWLTKTKDEAKISYR